MFLDRLINAGSSPLLERMLQFTGARQAVLGEDVVNLDTPGYRQKDLSVDKFQAMLKDRIDAENASPDGATSFDDIDGQLTSETGGILFHDGNNRSVEQLMSDQSKNALMHNLAVELLRKQYALLSMALTEKPG